MTSAAAGGAIKLCRARQRIWRAFGLESGSAQAARQGAGRRRDRSAMADLNERSAAAMGDCKVKTPSES